MMYWQKLAVAGLAAIGAAAIATPASAAGPLQSHKMVTTSDGRRGSAILVGSRRGRGRDDDDDGFNLHFGFGAPFFYGGYPYRYHRPYRYSYYDDYDYEDSYLNCHGKKWRQVRQDTLQRKVA